MKPSVQQLRISKLEELADVDEASLFRGKTIHFCQIDSPYNRELESCDKAGALLGSSVEDVRPLHALR